MGQYYKDYSDFLREHFSGKMQKLTVNAGFSCPNRDGTLSRGGCAYCNNTSFSPNMGSGSVCEQLQSGKQFFERKYPEMRYLAYFQSYTNTHGDLQSLLALYREALAVEKVEGLIIGTRPDCVSDELLDALAAFDKPVMMEYGAESSHNAILQAVNRCHTWQQTEDAVQRTAARGLSVGLHFIMGLPGETECDMLITIARAMALPIDTIKLHQLQIIKGTALAANLVCDEQDVSYNGLKIHQFTVDEYVTLCVKIVKMIRQYKPNIAIERFTSQAPEELLISPRWGLKNYQFSNLLNNKLKEEFGVN